MYIHIIIYSIIRETRGFGPSVLPPRFNLASLRGFLLRELAVSVQGTHVFSAHFFSAKLTHSLSAALAHTTLHTTSAKTHT